MASDSATRVPPDTAESRESAETTNPPESTLPPTSDLELPYQSRAADREQIAAKDDLTADRRTRVDRTEPDTGSSNERRMAGTDGANPNAESVNADEGSADRDRTTLADLRSSHRESIAGLDWQGPDSSRVNEEPARPDAVSETREHPSTPVDPSDGLKDGTPAPEVDFRSESTTAAADLGPPSDSEPSRGDPDHGIPAVPSTAPESVATEASFEAQESSEAERRPDPLDHAPTDRDRVASEAVDEMANGAPDVPATESGRHPAADLQQEGDTTVPEVTSAEVAPERADRPHDVTKPQVTTDYYTNVPPTVEDRFFVRDQDNPIPVFDGPPTRDQLEQGQFGDCGIVSTLGAVAGHRPADIEDAIKQTGEGKFEITFHEVNPATPHDPVANPTGDTVTYKINDQLPVRTDEVQRPLAGLEAETCGWAALFEKAVAAQDQTWTPRQHSDWEDRWQSDNKPAVDDERSVAGLHPSPDDPPMGYNRLDVGSTPYERADLLAQLTGREAEVREIPDGSHGSTSLIDEFHDRLADGKPILVGTRGRLFEAEHAPLSERVFSFGHAYEVIKVDNGMIHLQNPWGEKRNPPPIDSASFLEYFRQYNQDRSRIGFYTTLK